MNWKSLETAFCSTRIRMNLFVFLSPRTMNYDWVWIDLEHTPSDIAAFIKFSCWGEATWHQSVPCCLEDTSAGTHLSHSQGAQAFLTPLCPKCDHVPWANITRRGEQWEWMQACEPWPNHSNAKMEIPVGKSWFWMWRWLSSTFPFIFIISAMLLRFLNSLAMAHTQHPWPLHSEPSHASSPFAVQSFNVFRKEKVPDV